MRRKKILVLTSVVASIAPLGILRGSLLCRGLTRSAHGALSHPGPIPYLQVSRESGMHSQLPHMW